MKHLPYIQSASDGSELSSAFSKPTLSADPFEVIKSQPTPVTSGVSTFTPAALPFFGITQTPEALSTVDTEVPATTAEEALTQNQEQLESVKVDDRGDIDKKSPSDPAQSSALEEPERVQQQEVQDTDSSSKRSSLISSDGSSTPQTPQFRRQPSSTAVPLRFRRPPSSPSLHWESQPILPYVEPATSPATPTRSRQSRPASTEFKNTKEYRPLYLLERNRQTPDLEDPLPSLPSSNSDSRTPSVHESSDNDAYESALESPNAPPSVQSDYFVPPIGTIPLVPDDDYLDSGQTTPRATTLSPGGSQKHSDYFDIDSSSNYLPAAPSNIPHDVHETASAEQHGAHAHSDSVASAATVTGGVGTLAATSTQLDEKDIKKDWDASSDTRVQSLHDYKKDNDTVHDENNVIGTVDELDARGNVSEDNRDRESLTEGSNEPPATKLKSKTERKRDKKARKSKKKTPSRDKTDHEDDSVSLARIPTRDASEASQDWSVTFVGDRSQDLDTVGTTQTPTDDADKGGALYETSEITRRPADQHQTKILDHEIDTSDATPGPDTDYAPNKTPPQSDHRDLQDLVASTESQPESIRDILLYSDSVDLRPAEPASSPERLSENASNAIATFNLEQSSEAATAIKDKFPTIAVDTAQTPGLVISDMDLALSTALPDTPDHDLAIDTEEILRPIISDTDLALSTALPDTPDHDLAVAEQNITSPSEPNAFTIPVNADEQATLDAANVPLPEEDEEWNDELVFGIDAGGKDLVEEEARTEPNESHTISQHAPSEAFERGPDIAQSNNHSQTEAGFHDVASTPENKYTMENIEEKRPQADNQVPDSAAVGSTNEAGNRPSQSSHQGANVLSDGPPETRIDIEGQPEAALVNAELSPPTTLAQSDVERHIPDVATEDMQAVIRGTALQQEQDIAEDAESSSQQDRASRNSDEDILFKTESRDPEFDQMLAASLSQAGFDQSSLGLVASPQILRTLESEQPGLEFGDVKGGSESRTRSRTPSPTQLWATSSPPHRPLTSGPIGDIENRADKFGDDDESQNLPRDMSETSNEQKIAEGQQGYKAIEAAASAAGLAAASLSAGKLLKREPLKSSKKSKKKNKAVQFERLEDHPPPQERIEEAVGPAEPQTEKADPIDEYVKQQTQLTNERNSENTAQAVAETPQPPGQDASADVPQDVEDDWAKLVTSKKAKRNKKAKRTSLANVNEDVPKSISGEEGKKDFIATEPISIPKSMEPEVQETRTVHDKDADAHSSEWAMTSVSKESKKGRRAQFGETEGQAEANTVLSKDSSGRTDATPDPDLKGPSPETHREALAEDLPSTPIGETLNAPGQPDITTGVQTAVSETPALDVDPSASAQTKNEEDDTALFPPTGKQSRKDKKKKKQKLQERAKTMSHDDTVETKQEDVAQGDQQTEETQESTSLGRPEPGPEELSGLPNDESVTANTKQMPAEINPIQADDEAMVTPMRKLSKKEQKKQKKQNRQTEAFNSQPPGDVNQDTLKQDQDGVQQATEESRGSDTFLAREEALEEGDKPAAFEQAREYEAQPSPVADPAEEERSEVTTPKGKQSKKAKKKDRKQQAIATEQIKPEPPPVKMEDVSESLAAECDLEEGRKVQSGEEQLPSVRPEHLDQRSEMDVWDVAPPEATSKSRDSSLFVSPPTQKDSETEEDREGESFARQADGDEEHHHLHQLHREGSQRSLGLLPGDKPSRSETPHDSEMVARDRSPESDDEESSLSVGRRRSRPLEVIAEGSGEASREQSPDSQGDVEERGLSEGAVGTNVSPAGSELANTRRAYIRSRSPASATYSTASGDLVRPSSALSDHSRAGSTASNPALRRMDEKSVARSISSDLRAAAKRDASSADKSRAAGENGKAPLATLAALGGVAAAAAAASLPSDYEPLKGPGVKNTRDRRQDMSDGGIFEAYGDARGSPRSPTRPPSVRKRQSLQVLDLQNRLDEALAENDSLKRQQGLDDAGATTSMQKTLQARDIALNEKEIEVKTAKAALATLQAEAERLSAHNSQLQTANDNLGADVNRRYAALQQERDEAHGKWQESSRAFEDLQHKHAQLSSGMESVVRRQVDAALDDRDAEIKSLRAQLEMASTRIETLQRQVGAASGSTDDFLNAHDEDYFDSACQQLFRAVQQWVLRFSKFSDNRKCRLSSEVADEGIEARLDNAMLDGTDVDDHLADRVLRRDIFMSVVMTMLWEYVFTRYLFGMDREQRQKLKLLEKTLSEVGPTRAVALWRATTLSLLSHREAFLQQRSQDTDAVVHEVLQTLGRILPPPGHLAKQVQDSLRNVISLAVDLSIEMRTQRAEYIMLPPLRPEFDTNGELARKVYFNATLMNEKSGQTGSNEELEQQLVTVRTVLFPLVVKRGNDFGETDEEIVVHPAQVLTSGRTKRRSGVMSGANRSTISIAPPPSEGGTAEDPADMV